jgi:hypothetical protein
MILCGNCHHKVHAGVIDFVTDKGSFLPVAKKPPKTPKQVLAQKRIERNRELVAREKGLGCLICCEGAHCCLVFHHVDPEEKDLAVSVAMQAQWSEERLLQEISKCVVLCVNCHSKLHAGLVELGDAV